MGVLKRKKSKRLVHFLIFLAATTAIIFLLDNAAMMIYPVKYRELVQKYSKEYGVDPFLVFAIIKVESNFDPDAVSPKNAAGLMQITEKTGGWGARELDIKNYKHEMLFDPGTNVRLGCWYLSVLYGEFGKTDLVIAAYNGGSGNVSQWLNDSHLSSTGKQLDRIPFRETERYLKKVTNSYKIYKRLYENRF